MRCLLSRFAVAVCFFLVGGCATLAIGQSAEQVTPPHAVGVNPPAVRPAPLHTEIYAPPSTTPPYWTKLNNAPPVSVGAMLLLTDGRVLVMKSQTAVARGCAGSDYTAWYFLTPDINGSYVNGTWSQKLRACRSDYGPLYFGSAVLPDGNVVVDGGEYLCPAGNAFRKDHGPILPPSTMPRPIHGLHWRLPLLQLRGPHWRCAESVVLPNGTYMQADCCGVVAADAKRSDGRLL